MRISKLEVILEAVSFGEKSIKKAMEEIDELYGRETRTSLLLDKLSGEEKADNNTKEKKTIL